MKAKRHEADMVKEKKINARLDRLDIVDSSILTSSLHGIAARLDNLPPGLFHNKMTIMFGGIIFCACLDMYVSGGLVAHFTESGWATVEESTFLASITAVGYFFGALISGFIADHLGRRKGLLITMMLLVVTTFIAAFAPNIAVLTIVRGFIGVGLGATLAVSYGSFGEYVPPSQRGRYSAWIGLIGNFSPPLGALLILMAIPLVGWRPVFVGIAMLSFLVWIAVFKFVPESPRWLASRGRTEEADEIVTKAEAGYGARGIDLPELDDEELVEKLEMEAQSLKPSWRFLFREKLIKRTVSACCVLFAMNIMVQAVTVWTPTAFVLEGRDALTSTALIVVMLIGAPFGIFILGLLADKFDRKKSLVILLVVLALLGIVWSLIPDEHVVWIMFIGFVFCAVLYYYAILACGVYVGEIFPTEVRMRGVGFSNAFGRLAAIISPYYTAYLLQTFGFASVFLVNAIVLLVIALVLAMVGIETRSRPLEDINDGLLK